MRAPHHAFAALSFAALLAGQAPTKADGKDVLALVSRAEAALKSKETEEAILLLWQALDQLGELPANPVLDSARLSALFLLEKNDPLEARRRAAFGSVAKQQVELAALYRGKKWFDVAANRLDVADGYDRDAGKKERGLLDAARPKPKVEGATPAEPPRSKLAPLLQRANIEYHDGEWKEDGEVLECHAPPGKHIEWITKQAHGDHEIVVEFRPKAPAEEHNVILTFGLSVDAANATNGYRLAYHYAPKGKRYGLYFLTVRGMQVTDLGTWGWGLVSPTEDGFHRLSVQVRGSRLRAQVDGGAAVEADAGQAVRGTVGLMQGIADTPTCAVQFRNFRVDPLPADMPTDDELREKAALENQNEITKAVDAAKELIAKKQPEPASLKLREALGRIRDMDAGVLRDNLSSAIERMLAETDPFAVRRRKAAQTSAAELVALGDAYAKAGMVRAAEVLVADATGFDPDGLAARLAAANEAVRQWNVAQASARANELAPPADDGAVLREWFAKGRKLDTYTQAMVIDGAEAKAQVPPESFVAWLPQPTAAPLSAASVYVHLVADAEEAGLCCDVVDSTQFTLVTLERRRAGIRMIVYRRTGQRWLPLAQRDVPMDAWRRDGWHKLAIAWDDKGVVAK